MRKNEYKSINQFLSQYTGEWNPSEGHWLGLDFIYKGKEYRFHTGAMYENESSTNEEKNVFGLYRKKNYIGKDGKEYELLGEYENITGILDSSVIEGTAFKKIIVDEDTELIGQD